MPNLLFSKAVLDLIDKNAIMVYTTKLAALHVIINAA